MNVMKRIILLSMSLLSVALATNSPAKSSLSNDTLVEKVEGFLNGTKSMKARFVQVTTDVDGTIVTRTGRFSWLRPGYIKFAYDGKPFLQVIADGDSFMQKDEDGRSLPISIDNTPAGLILKKTISLKKDAIVKNVIEQDGMFFITVVSKQDPHSGTLTLVFQKSPFFLKQWTVLDNTGRLVDLILVDHQFGLPLTKKDFKFD